MSEFRDLDATAKDLVDLGTKATDEKITGVSQRLKLVEDSITQMRQAVSKAEARLEGIDARINNLQSVVARQTVSIEQLTAAVSKETGYKEGLKDGFKVLHWVTGIICAVLGGAVTLLAKYIMSL